MQSQIDQLSPVLVQVAVEVPWTKVNEGLEGAYRNMQRTAKVRGFRPGKVPRNVVKNIMGKAIEREVALRLVEEGLQAAVSQHSLDPVAMADMGDTPALTQGEPMRFSVKLEVRPKIESVDTSGLAVERRIAEVVDADVEAELEKVRQQNAELRAPDPARPAKAGDVLGLQIEVAVDGKPRADLTSENTRAELGKERLLPELEAGLLGSSVDDRREITVNFPADYGREDLQGKPALFSVHVKEIQEPVLPELDDDLARDVGNESLAEWRKKTRETLEAEAERRADAELREALVDLMIDKNPVPVPPSMIERQEQSMMRELYQLQQMLGRPVPFGDDMHAEMHTRAERRVRAGLLFGAIADREKIEVTAADVDKRLGEVAAQSGKHLAKVRAEYQGERLTSLQSQLLQNKLLEYLLAQATITDVRGAAAEQPETKSESSAESKAKKPESSAETKTESSAETAEKKPAKKATKKAAEKPAKDEG